MRNKRDGVVTLSLYLSLSLCNVVNLCVRNAWLFKFNVINLEIIKLAKLNIVISKPFFHCAISKPDSISFLAVTQKQQQQP